MEREREREIERERDIFVRLVAIVVFKRRFKYNI
jgi:hypothetical protein